MIKIEIPTPDVVLTKSNKTGDESEGDLSSVYGFTDYRVIPRDKGGIFMFYDINEQLLYVGKARKLRQRIKKNFEDSLSPIRKYRDDVYKIAVCEVENPMDREIYETYIINTLQAKYNIDKVFYK
jgi:excinuclease UvrABC nuclease subunit